jgi:CDP-glycerol glycerophosphotransferase (TagB/SpsB family)
MPTFCMKGRPPKLLKLEVNKSILLAKLRFLDDLIFDNFGKIRLLFVIRNTIGYQCLLPLIRQVIMDESFVVRITKEHEGCFQFLDNNESQQLLQNYYIAPHKVVYRKWHYVFLTDRSNLYFSRHTTIVSTSHASTHGNMDLDKRGGVKQLDYWTTMATEPNISLVFMNAASDFNLVLRESNDTLIGDNRDVLITGFIKSNTIINSDYYRNKETEIYEKYQLAHDRDIVVITSHWTKKSLLNNVSTLDIELLFLKFPNFSFILMGHPLLWSDHDSSDRRSPLYLAFQLLDKENDNFHFLPYVDDVSEITCIADYFILDYTSYFVEACMANKPIVFFEHKDFVFRIKKVGSLYRSASTHFSESKDLVTVFSDIQMSPDTKEEHRKRITNYFIFEPENVVNYIVKSLKSMGKVSGPHSRSWTKLVKYCQKERFRRFGETNPAANESRQISI